MGSKERLEFSDINEPRESTLTFGKGGRGGCYISTATGFVLAFLGIAIAVGIGLIVHFASPASKFECHCNYPTNIPGGDTGGQVGGTGVTTTKPTTEVPGTTTAIPATTMDMNAMWKMCNDMITNMNKTICDTCESTTTVPTTDTPSIPELLTDIRLPTSLEPILYDVELQANMYSGDPKAFTFEGYVHIKMRVKSATNNITLHINKLTIHNSSLSLTEDTGGPAPNIDHYDLDLARQFIIFHLDANLETTKEYTIKMNFTGPLADDLAGLYLSSYKRGNDTIYIATSQLQATDARKTFPCFDEPAIKAKFNTILVRDPSMVSLSNMPIIRNETRPNGMIADIYNTTEKMSTYLLAFIICDFEYKYNYTENGVLYRAWARPEAIDQVDYALDVGVKILQYFEEYFAIKFPLPKQDMIAVPDFGAGAMENWGLITYRETAMLYDPDVSSEGNKQRVAVVVSHELAHQWFGDLVTPSWWDDLWLNEGFASYVEYMGVDFVHPEWKMFDQFVVVDLQDTFDFDGLKSSHPIYVPVGHPNEISAIFDRISYGKGACVIRMMKFFLGEDTFREGLTDYLNNRQYDAAFHDDLWIALTNRSIINGNYYDVKDIMDTWTLQMNFPVVNVVINRGTGGLTLTQSRFVIDPDAAESEIYKSPFGYQWDIPFTFTTSMSTNFSTIQVHMMQRNQSLALPGDGGFPDDDAWVIGNVKQYGYYRVNYDQTNWNALIKQLNNNHTAIHAINRAQIINDAWNLGKSGELDQNTALGTLEYLSKEEEYVPWSAASEQLGYVDEMLTRSSLYGAFQKFMVYTVQARWDALGWDNTGASHLESYMRSTISSLACKNGIEDCVAHAKTEFNTWMTTGTNPINAGLKTTAYCEAIAAGGVEEWDFAYGQYKTVNVAVEKSRLLYALSCSREPWILSRYLTYCLNPDEIRKQDAVSSIVYIASNPIGRSLVWDFVRDQWDYLMNVYGSGLFSFSSLISGMTRSFNTDFDLQQLKDFMAAHPDLGSGKTAFGQAIEKTSGNIKWMEKNENLIRDWLNGLGFE